MCSGSSSEEKANKRSNRTQLKINADNLAENARQFDAGFGESKRQFDTGFDENRRRYDERIERGIGTGSEGESQLLAETASAPTELMELKELIRQGALPEQNSADSRVALALREGGVTGPTAALERARSANSMSENLTRMIAEYALSDANKRRGIRSNYFGNKALAGRAATYQ